MKKAPYYLYQNNGTKIGYFVSKVERLQDFFEHDFLRRWDISQSGIVFKEVHVNKDYVDGRIIRTGSYTKEYPFVVRDDNCNAVSQNELYEAFNNFESEMKERKMIEGLFGVPDVERGVAVEGTGSRFRKVKQRRYRKLQNVCLNEIKQTCKQHLDEYEPRVRNKRNFYNMPYWEGYYTSDNVNSRNWKKYRNKQYK